MESVAVGTPPTLLAKEFPGRQTEAMVPLVPLTALAQLTTPPVAFSLNQKRKIITFSSMYYLSFC